MVKDGFKFHLKLMTVIVKRLDRGCLDNLTILPTYHHKLFVSQLIYEIQSEGAYRYHIVAKFFLLFLLKGRHLGRLNSFQTAFTTFNQALINC